MWSTTVRLSDLIPASAHVIGPTWRRRADTGAFLLPEYMLGWAIINWMAAFLAMLSDPDKSFLPTLEQARSREPGTQFDGNVTEYQSRSPSFGVRGNRSGNQA